MRNNVLKERRRLFNALFNIIQLKFMIPAKSMEGFTLNELEYYGIGQERVDTYGMVGT